MSFRAVLPADELWTGEMRGLVVDGQRVLLLRTAEGVFAYEDRCAHLGLPLSKGTLSGGVITCSAHHYQYEAKSGCGVNPTNIRLRPLPVRVEGDTIAIDPHPEEQGENA
jgi:toluene monooxygenase system ferredoxin subunit